MFDNLSSKLSGAFDKLKRRGALSEEDVNDALREIRLALLDADVALPVVKDFIGRVRERAVGAEVLDSVTPGQQVVKIVNEVLIEALGGAGAVPLNLNAPSPIPILMQITKMGSLSGILGMLPGVGKIKEQLDGANLDTSILKRQGAIISSMTAKERRTPDLIKASRKRRIAAGSGTSVQQVNQLLKQFDDMASMMKRMNKLGQKGLMRHGLSAIMPKGMQQQKRPY